MLGLFDAQGFVRCRKILHDLRESERSNWDDQLGSLVQEWSQNATKPDASSGFVSNYVFSLARIQIYLFLW